MNRICKIFIIFFITYFITCGGCNTQKSLVSDVDGWDVSISESGFDASWERFFDYVDKFYSSE